MNLNPATSGPANVRVAQTRWFRAYWPIMISLAGVVAGAFVMQSSPDATFRRIGLAMIIASLGIAMVLGFWSCRGDSTVGKRIPPRNKPIRRPASAGQLGPRLQVVLLIIGIVCFLYEQAKAEHFELSPRLIGHEGRVTRSDLPATDVIRQAIQACIQVHANLSSRPCAKFLLALSLNKRALWPLINDLCSVPDDLFDYARSVNTLDETFHENIGTICQRHAAVRHRFQALIPERVPQMSPAEILQSDVGRYQMQRRNVANLLEDYEIVELIGRGATGFVFRARPVRGGPERPEVAIKMQPSGWLNEVQFMSRYCHFDQIPGLVRLLDVFECGQYTFLVMELVQGHTVENRPIPDDETEAAQQLVSITYQMLAVLHRLHQQGLRHGDLLHLNNYMVDTTNNSVVLLDFERAESSESCSGDLTTFYLRTCGLLERTKIHFGLRRYESRPGLLYDFELALKSWPKRSWSCSVQMADPIFDSVRDIGPRSTANLYSEFPDMGHVLIDTNPPTPQPSSPIRSVRPKADPTPDPATIPSTPTSPSSPESIPTRSTSLLSSQQTTEQHSDDSQLGADQGLNEQIESGTSEEGGLAAPMAEIISSPALDAPDQYDSQHKRDYGKSKGSGTILTVVLFCMTLLLCCFLFVLPGRIAVVPW